MKKIALITCILVTAFLLIACSKGDAIQNNNEVLPSTDPNSSASTTYTPEPPIYDLIHYYYSSTVPPELEEAVRNNQIDKDYKAESEKPENGTSFGMEKTAAKFANIWKSEMHTSAAKLEKALNEKDKVLFEKEQTEWEEAMEAHFRFVSESLGGSTAYNVVIGSIFPYKVDENALEIYRQRTLEIKGIHFEIEQAQKGYNYSGDYESLKFEYQGQ
ncbi:MAG: hypothetical protein FWF45_06570 [Coriobacteriia bacterium]|nr:hypothetical protein [Coriobacteriia bacterium]